MTKNGWIVVAACVLACASSVGQASEKSNIVPDTRMASTFARVEPGDGIDQREARILAEAYLAHFVTGCGEIAEIADRGAAWEATTLVGRGAQVGVVIRVDKQTGSLSSAKGPTIEPPTGEEAVEEPSPPAENDAQMLELGEFVSTTRDEELHHVRISIALVYRGDEAFVKQKVAAIRDEVIQRLMKLTMEKAKEAYATRTLHADIETAVKTCLTVPGGPTIELRSVYLTGFEVR